MQTDMDQARAELGVACEQGNNDRVKQLIAWGVDVTGRENGAPFLRRAARNGQYVVIKTLIRAGAVPGHPELVAAVTSGSRYAADYIADGLFDAGEDPAAYTWGQVLGQREFLEQLTAEMAQWLVDQGVDLSETDTFGRSILTLAREYASPDVIAVFEAAG